MLNDRLANDVHRNGTHSSGTDDDRVLRCAGAQRDVLAQIGWVMSHWSIQFTVKLLFVAVQYVLSSGKDSMVRLWDLSMGRNLITYTGAGVTGKQEHRTNAIFNHTEDYGTFL